jgi:hypothetical protein
MQTNIVQQINGHAGHAAPPLTKFAVSRTSAELTTFALYLKTMQLVCGRTLTRTNKTNLRVSGPPQYQPVLPLLLRRPHDILVVPTETRGLPVREVYRVLVLDDVREERVRGLLFGGGGRQAGLSLLRRPQLSGGLGSVLDGDVYFEDAERAVGGVCEHVLAVAADDDLAHGAAACGNGLGLN